MRTPAVAKHIVLSYWSQHLFLRTPGLNQLTVTPTVPGLLVFDATTNPGFVVHGGLHG